MSVVRHGRMICFDDDAERFHMRAAGIALRQGRVLLQRAEGDIYWVPPGGRVEQGETSYETLLREMQEELQQTVKVGPLTFLLESFFGHAGRSFHEIGFYHPMVVPEGFPFSTDGVCHRVRDGGIEVEFAWLPADDASLTAAPFYPVPLRPLRSHRRGCCTSSTVATDDHPASPHRPRLLRGHRLLRPRLPRGVPAFLRAGPDRVPARDRVHHSELIGAGIAFAVRRMTIDFAAPAHIDDLLEVFTEVVSTTAARLNLRQTVFRSEALIATAEVQVVAIRMGGGAVRLPRNLLDAVGNA